ncbi:MAG: ABC transporter ATP-binding protein [Clostridia bacterium]|nr:ABC transporter ATP-binding protein [Clostridia bacterium]
MEENILEVKALRKVFKLSKKQQRLEKTNAAQRVAVDGLSFNVKRGEIYGLLGPNGAGKTTTLRMLSTLVKPDEGDAELFGFSILKDAEKVRQKIGFLTSELKPDEFFTPDYLFDFYSELYNIPTHVRDERKKELFSRFGIEKFAQTKIAELSTGMKQKVSIAISLVNDPDLIIFDEPTNGLDVLTAKTVTDFLSELRSRGKTVLLSTHIFSLVEKICDRVGVIIDGKMALEGDVKELTAEKDLEEVFFDLYARIAGGEQ